MIYLDNAATTKTSAAVTEKMLPWFSENYGNPSSIYKLGQKSKEAVTKARDQISKVINCHANEVFFTSGGSEANNWAIISAFEAFKLKGNHIITTKIEHPSVLNTCKYLERERGADITYLDVDEFGSVSPADIENAVKQNTILVSVMTANNEIGTIQPIKEIGSICRKNGIIFHTDAVQAFGHIPLNVLEMNIDMLSASGHKFNGPKGVGFLYIRKDIKVPAFIRGGAQEHNRRAGTENVPAIVGMGYAAEFANQDIEKRAFVERDLQKYFITALKAKITDIKLNGPQNLNNRLPNNINISFCSADGESIIIMLDMQDIYVSSGSACSSGSLDPSHVLKAIGLSDDLAHSAVRFTLSYENTKEELNIAADAVAKAVSKLRTCEF